MRAKRAKENAMELHIEAQHSDLEPDLQDWIRERLEALNAPEQDILHARVTVVKHIHHRRGSDEARVMLVLAGKSLSATCTSDTIADALYEVHDVIERELHDFRTVRRGIVKAPGPRPHGRIVRMFPDESYGFIETEAHRDVYFHANAVHGIPFAQLHVNMVVDLDIEAGHAGLQATRVTPHWP
jgi:cold shock CspA family protein/ribosome-associated translation inhibitor RaiA